MNNHDLITGYQYAPTGRYIGPYEFEKNGDQEAIHAPPNTTLIAPPEAVPGKFAQWNREAECWELVDVPAPAPRQPMPVPHADPLAAQVEAVQAAAQRGDPLAAQVAAQHGEVSNDN
jgi:hypothetical protein